MASVSGAACPFASPNSEATAEARERETWAGSASSAVNSPRMKVGNVRPSCASRCLPLPLPLLPLNAAGAAATAMLPVEEVDADADGVS